MRARTATTGHMTWKILVLSMVLALALVPRIDPAEATEASAAGEDSGPTTSYEFESEPGDYIGGGQSKSYAPPDTRFRMYGSLKSVTVKVDAGNGEHWYIILAARPGEKLRPGVYENAKTAGDRGGSPGIDVFGSGRGCTVTGSFVVYQIRADDSGRVKTLDAAFEQRCEWDDAALRGKIKVNARPLSFAYRSAAGDPVGDGLTGEHLGHTSTFDLATTNQRLTYEVIGEGNSWSAIIAPPSRERLLPGTYITAPVASAGVARLDVMRNGVRCDGSAGTLTVNSISRNRNGRVTGLNADFTQQCEGAEGTLSGTIRFRE